MVVLFRLKSQFLQFYNLNLQVNIIHLKKIKHTIFFRFSNTKSRKRVEISKKSFYCQELPDYKVVWGNRTLGEL